MFKYGHWQNICDNPQPMFFYSTQFGHTQLFEDQNYLLVITLFWVMTEWLCCFFPSISSHPPLGLGHARVTVLPVLWCCPVNEETVRMINYHLQSAHTCLTLHNPSGAEIEHKTRPPGGWPVLVHFKTYWVYLVVCLSLYLHIFSEMALDRFSL